MNITLFSSATCTPCRSIKQYLKMKGLTYNEVDAAEQANASLLLKLTGENRTPTVLVQNGDKTSVVIGLNYGKLASALTE